MHLLRLLHRRDERCLPELRRRARREAASPRRRVASPWAASATSTCTCRSARHRCGYCDFVTVVGRGGEHGATSTRCSPSSSCERRVLAPELETVFLGGGTPTFTEPAALVRLLDALPAAAEVTVEANPGDGHAGARARCCANGVDRVSLGRAELLSRACSDVLDRVASPDDVRRAFHRLRDAGFDNISLDLVYGIPGQSAADLGTRPRRGARASRPSTSPRTSSKPSRARASRTRTEPSSRARPRRWRPTSSASSRR